MWLAWKQARSRTQPDPHYQSMLKYKEVPMWWYLGLFVLAFFAGLIVNIKGQTTMPAWEYIVALVLGAFIAPFSCILYGLYGSGVGTNLISKMIAGALHPGRPLANLYLASWVSSIQPKDKYSLTNSSSSPIKSFFLQLIWPIGSKSVNIQRSPLE